MIAPAQSAAEPNHSKTNQVTSEVWPWWAPRSWRSFLGNLTGKNEGTQMSHQHVLWLMSTGSALRGNCKIEAEIPSVMYMMNQKPESEAGPGSTGFGIRS